MSDRLLRHIGERPNVIQRIVRWVAETRLGAFALAAMLRPIDGCVLRLTSGRGTFTSVAAGLPTIVLSTTGARTGRRRSTVVLGIPVGESVAVVAGNFGQPRPPAWMHNLISHPAATIQVAGRTTDVTARLLHDPERQAVLNAAVAVFPPYAAYARRLRGRELPVFILERPSARDGESS